MYKPESTRNKIRNTTFRSRGKPDRNIEGTDDEPTRNTRDDKPIYTVYTHTRLITRQDRRGGGVKHRVSR